MFKRISIFCCILATACTVGPNYEKVELYSDDEIKEELHLKEGNIIETDWFKQFNDNTLNKLIDLGRQNNTDIAIAISRLRQARANLNIDRTTNLPMINAQGGYTYEKNSKNIGPTADADYFSIGFDASWELDLWGKNRRQIEADKAQIKGLEYTLKDIKVTLVSEIAKSYINLMQKIEELYLTKRNISLQKETLELVKSKYENGLTDEISYNQAQYLLKNLEGQVPNIQSQIEEYKNSLSLLIGILPSEIPVDINKRSPIFKQSYKYNTKMVYNLPVSTIRNRPDVVATEQELIAQNALVGKAIAEIYPSINISALWGLASINGSQLFNSNSQNYSYSPLIDAPLLDWNRLQNNVKIQKYIREEHLNKYKNTVRQAIVELKNAMTIFQNNITRNNKQIQALNNINKVVSLSRDKYKNGLIEYSDLLQSEQNLLDSQQQYINGKAQIMQSVVAYYKACGGGYANN